MIQSSPTADAAAAATAATAAVAIGAAHLTITINMFFEKIVAC